VLQTKSGIWLENVVNQADDLRIVLDQSSPKWDHDLKKIENSKLYYERPHAPDGEDVICPATTRRLSGNIHLHSTVSNMPLFIRKFTSLNLVKNVRVAWRTSISEFVDILLPSEFKLYAISSHHPCHMVILEKYKYSENIVLKIFQNIIIVDRAVTWVFGIMPTFHWNYWQPFNIRNYVNAAWICFVNSMVISE